MEREGLSPVCMKKLRWFLSFLVSALGKRPIAQISPHELLAALQAVEKRGKHETAKRMRATCSQVFRYAIATARCDRDVAHDLKGALTVLKVAHRPAVTSPIEVGALLRAIAAFEGCSVTRAALRLLPHVFVRTGCLVPAFDGAGLG